MLEDMFNRKKFQKTCRGDGQDPKMIFGLVVQQNNELRHAAHMIFQLPDWLNLLECIESMTKIQKKEVWGYTLNNIAEHNTEQCISKVQTWLSKFFSNSEVINHVTKQSIIVISTSFRQTLLFYQELPWVRKVRPGRLMSIVVVTFLSYAKVIGP